jgi:hypothetical protein
MRANLNIVGAMRDQRVKVKIIDGARRFEVHDGLVTVVSEENTINIAVIHLAPGEFVTIDEVPTQRT